ncbi:MAG: Phosphate transport system permease protein PstA [Gammaproteobacteria bacterium]|nr:phosphate ABC transporter, permease protein PstA [Flavobacteriaceae bacterium]CAI8353650.1 MAG: Phosphate transport system permease protein PstA [Gammaproteobacteria bacterium]|tara:strand:+ start:351 stop:1568 length:1218 start_codon:yes stop_codon:yes gene_type:complete
MNNILSRNNAEKRFKVYGFLAVSTAIVLLGILLFKIFSTGISAFNQSYIGVKIEINNSINSSEIDPRTELRQQLRNMFPELTTRAEKRTLYSLFSTGATYEFEDLLKANEGKTINDYYYFLASDDVDMYVKGTVKREGDSAGRLMSDQLKILDQFEEQNLVELHINKYLLAGADSREPEMAGIKGAIYGTFYAILIAFITSFPLGVLTAIYLEKLAKKNRLSDIIETNINNLAAVPSIVFGLLGLAIFLNFFNLPRSAPLVGGLTLGLMTLPTIVIAARSAIKSVPPSIEEAAIGLGSSKVQTIFNFTLPLAMPGILTGTIIGIAQAIGETAPLLMIGMVAFVVDIPGGPMDPATALPVQIYLWADSPERAFVERTSAAIMVLLIFLFLLNITAVYLRKKLEKKW